jgi:hypothetical protein
MKKALAIEDDLQPEYDFSKLTKVGRGIFAGGRRLSAEAVKALNEGKPAGQFVGVGKNAAGARAPGAIRSGRGRRG